MYCRYILYTVTETYSAVPTDPLVYPKNVLTLCAVNNVPADVWAC